MRISDWSSDVCSSDLMALTPIMQTPITQTQARTSTPPPRQPLGDQFRMRPGLMPWTRSYAPESGKRSTGDGYRGGGRFAPLFFVTLNLFGNYTLGIRKPPYFVIASGAKQSRAVCAHPGLLRSAPNDGITDAKTTSANQ